MQKLLNLGTFAEPNKILLGVTLNPAISLVNTQWQSVNSPFSCASNLASGGYCFSTDGQIYNWPFVIVESLSRLKSNQRRGGLLLDRRTYDLTFVNQRAGQSDATGTITQ